MRLFLDDLRNPTDCLAYMGTRVNARELALYDDEWLVVRNYTEFKDAINEHAHKLTYISFDHDLAEEHYSEKMYTSMEEYYADIEGKGQTGLDCAKYAHWFYKENHLLLPHIIVHSMNPVGAKAIGDVFTFSATQ